jgi:hypothetical protein
VTPVSVLFRIAWINTIYSVYTINQSHKWVVQKKKKIEIDSSYYLRHGVVHCENGSSKLYEEKKWNTFGSFLRKN